MSDKVINQEILRAIDEMLDIAPGPTPVKGATRSSEWPAVERAYIKKNPCCAICGGKVGLNAHHIIPFEYGGPELDENNLITLCRGTFNCHLLFGHLGDWQGANPLVRADALDWQFRFRARKTLLKLIKVDEDEGQPEQSVTPAVA